MTWLHFVVMVKTYQTTMHQEVFAVNLRTDLVHLMMTTMTVAAAIVKVVVAFVASVESKPAGVASLQQEPTPFLEVLLFW